MPFTPTRPRHPMPTLGRDGDWLLDEPAEQEPQGAYRCPNENTWAGGYKEPPPIPPWSPEHAVVTADLGKLCDKLEAETGEFYGYSGSLRVRWHHFRQRPDEFDRAVLLQYLRELVRVAEKAERSDLVAAARDLAALAETCPLKVVDVGERGGGVALAPAGVRRVPEPA